MINQDTLLCVYLFTSVERTLFFKEENYAFNNDSFGIFAIIKYGAK